MTGADIAIVVIAHQELKNVVQLPKCNRLTEAKHNQALPHKAECLIEKIQDAYPSIFLANTLSRYFSKAIANVRYTIWANFEYGMYMNSINTDTRCR